jgi:hypothetical protein
MNLDSMGVVDCGCLNGTGSKELDAVPGAENELRPRTPGLAVAGHRNRGPSRGPCDGSRRLAGGRGIPGDGDFEDLAAGQRG